MAQQQWSVVQDVREDADSVFVPVDQLPSADVGDAVEVVSEHSGMRRGQVTARVEDAERGTFLTVSLDAPTT